MPSNCEIHPHPIGSLSGAAPAVRIVDLGKRFGSGPQVLDAISLEAERGSFTAVIGPSGCGKTTLLRLLAGLDDPSCGSIEVLGRPPREARRDLGYVFQEPTLLPWRTVRRNLELLPELNGLSQADRRKRAEEQAARVGLTPALDRYPCQLSTGMRMRASVARALTLAPRLLLLDEPFGAIDELHRDQLDEELLRLQAQAGWTAFFVTHSVSEAVFLATRIVVLSANPGRVAQVIDVPFARPRDASLREDPQFLHLVAETSAALRRVPR